MQRPILLCLMALLCSIVSRAQITSTFDSDADGWTIFFGASGASIPGTHNPTGGNPDGHASLTYASATNSVQSWIAPAKFRGNKVVRSLGMNLRFDLQQSIASTNPGNQGDVRIESSVGTIIYVFAIADRPTTTWRSYSIKLDETAGWRWNSTTGALATRSQIKAALGDIDALEIAASYAQNVSYTARIDNVVLEEKPLGVAPVLTNFSPTNGFPGTIVTITGTSFDPTPANNAVFFSGMRADIVAASSTQLQVEVPDGAGFGAITVVNIITGLSAESLRPFIPTFPNGGRLIPSSFNRRVDLTVTGVTNLNGLTAADVDDDGWMDVLVSESGNTISVFRNLGTGGDLTPASFAPKFSLTGAGNSSGLKLVDIDGDGKNDIVGHTEIASVTYFATFRNTSTPGNLSFEAGEFWYGLVYSGSFSAVVDVDGDGRADLIGQHGNGSVSPDLWIAQNISTPGNIEFAISQSFFGGSTLDAGDGVAYGDLDNDGKPELIVEHSFGGQFQIIQNTSTPGSISFGTPFPISEGVNGGVVVADINADGKNDLLFKQGSSNDDVNIRLNSYTGGVLSASDFSTAVVLNTDLNTYGGVSVADMNGDGKLDILATDSYNLTVFENIYDGGVFSALSFVPGYLHEGVANSTYPTTPIACDFNGDARLDILIGITNTNPIRLGFYQNTNVIAPRISVNTVSPLKGPVGSVVTITGSNFSSVPLENTVMFGSVKANIISASASSISVEVPAGSSYDYVSVSRNGLTSRYHLPFNVIFAPAAPSITSASFAPPVDISMPTPDFDIDIADLNGDSKLDIVAEGASLFAYVFRNDHTSGPLTSGSFALDHTTATSAANLKLIDLDVDGKPDIASANGIYRNTSSPSDISFNPTVGAGSTTNIGVGDLNLDGRLDFTGVTGTSLSLLENRTRAGDFVSGTFASVASPSNLAAGGTGVASVVADFDNDGYPDGAVTTSADALVVFRNNSAPRVINTYFSNSGSFATLDLPGRIYEADVDVDGKMDLVVYHQGTGTSGNFWSLFHNTSTPGLISFTRVDFQVGPSPGTSNVVCGPSTVSDLDGDGRPEVIITSASTTAANQGFLVFKNNTTPGNVTSTSFTSSGLIQLAGARAVDAADLNGDSRPELIFTRTGNRLTIIESILPITALTFTTQPATATLCDVIAADLTASATGDNNLQYRWQKFNTVTNKFEDVPDDATYDGINSPTLDISNPPSQDTYRVIVQGDYSLGISASAVLTVSTSPAAPTGTGDTECSDSAVSLSASGGTNGNYRWYTSASGGSPLSGETNSTYVTPILTSTTSYFVALNNSGCESTRTEVIATINVVNPPTVINGSRCDAGTVNVSSAGATNGQYRWYETATGPTQISGEVNNVFTTPSISATTSYYVSINDGSCESSRTEVIATVTSTPSAPTAINNSRCDNGTLNIGASGGANGNYRWYDVASGGTPISGEVNSSFTTPALSATTTYHVALSDGTCESTRIPVIATINTPPAKPSITSSVSPSGNTVTICNGAVTLSAPAGFVYAWSNGATTQQISVSTAGTFTVQVIDGNSCSSVASDPIQIVINPNVCNTAPVVVPEALTTSISGNVSLTISDIVTDAENNFDNIVIVTPPISGATVTIVNGVLMIDYSNVTFSGTDQLVIRACDVQNLCSENVTITIEVVGEIEVFNAVSPNGDGLNEFLRIQYIEVLERTRNNRVTILNRWGDKVFEVSNYDNNTRAFKGMNNNGVELPSGTYFYKIEFSGPNAPAMKTGYFSLKR